ncbi:hypothetical protein [Leptospira levettii]|nr:hypothetical protein [Leptospira levettii]
MNSAKGKSMHEEADKKECILKFLKHINLANKDEIVDFTKAVYASKL